MKIQDILFKFIISISLFSLSISSIFGQQQTEYKQLINKSISYLNKGTVVSDFKIEIKEKNNVNSQDLVGKLKLNGRKFYILTDEMQVWFDGKTQWAYSKSSNEVSITEPGSDEIASMNPLAVLAGLRDKGSFSALSRKGLNGKGVKIIPAKASMNLISCELDIEMNSGKIFQIWIRDKRGSESSMILLNQKLVKVNPADFVFKTSLLPKAVVNDLR